MAATPRSRGALSGTVLVVLGTWGALIPFVGTYFHDDYASTSHWTMTSARFFLEVAPGIVTALGALLVLISGNRFAASVGGYAVAAAGAWFIVGPVLAPLFRTGYLGVPTGGKTQVAVEQIGFFYGLGGVIVLLAAFALGRFSVVGVRDVAVGEKRAQRKAEGDQPQSQDAARRLLVRATTATTRAPFAPSDRTQSGASRTTLRAALSSRSPW